MNIVLNCPTPFDGESLTSIIYRAAELNYIEAHEIWRFALPQGAHYPQSAISSLLNVVPDSAIDISVLSKMLDLSHEQLEGLTFIPVIKKVFYANNHSNISSQRFSSTLIVKPLRFCPLCLREKPYYRLIWQVQELDICIDHKVYLIEKCPYCKRSLPQLTPHGIIGFCPYCINSLCSVETKKATISSFHKRLIQDWSYLLNQY